VIAAVRSAYRGESTLHPVMARKLLDNLSGRERRMERGGGDDFLTPRELDVLKWMVKGLSNKEIAEQLFISDKTVKIHVSNIFKKDRKSTRLNSSHVKISYAVFCLKKK